MPHAAGWTLGTLRILYSQLPNSEIIECVLHYDLTGYPATAANANTLSGNADTYVAAGIAGLINTQSQYIGCSMLLDDGMIQAPGTAGTPTAGAGGGAPMNQVLCGIIRKRCNAHGRKRFGHTCHPFLDDSMIDDAQHLSAAFATSLNGFYAGLNDASVLFSIAGANHIVYHRSDDTRDAVYYYQADRVIKTQRHRMIGRGI